MSIHTHTAEGYFSIFQRAMMGVCQHCSEKRRHRCLAEFDFRCNNRIALGVDDIGRVSRIVKAAEDERLTCRRPDRTPG